MRVTLHKLSDRLLDKVAPKARASAVACWQYECIAYSGCPQKKAYWAYDPCNDRDYMKWCGC